MATFNLYLVASSFLKSTAKALSILPFLVNQFQPGFYIFHFFPQRFLRPGYIGDSRYQKLVTLLLPGGMAHVLLYLRLAAQY